MKPDVPDNIVISTSEDVYYWVSAIKDLADIRKMDQSYSSAFEKVEKNKLESMISGAIEYKTIYVVQKSDELSFALPGEKGKNDFIHIDYFYCKPDKRKEAKEILKQFRELSEVSKLTLEYDTYTTVLGQDRDLIIIIRLAPDQETFLKKLSEAWEKGGPELVELNQKFMSCLRAYENESAYYRHDLTYHNEKAALQEKK